MSKSPVALLILDGWGHRTDPEFNAPALAKTPNFDRLWQTRPTSLLSASGLDVGLPEGQIGNSEVGHLNIGAGRVVMQTLPRIDEAVAKGDIPKNSVFQETVAKAKAGTGRVHLLGLMSAGGVHSHQRHVAALARDFHAVGLKVILHLITDGRDTAPAIAAQCFEAFWEDLQVDGPFSPQIGSVSGRYYAMDRDQRWERTGQALSAIRDGEGPTQSDVLAALKAVERDEFVEPFVVSGYSGMQPGDALACANFRSDRVRQILRALLIPGTPGFRDMGFSTSLAMTPYADDLDAVTGILFPKDQIAQTLAQVASEAGKTQFHTAETEKYPHVTFFLNGGREEPWPGEARTVVPSPKVATYDLAPEMSAAGVSKALNEAVGSGDFDLLICNFANPDMVGHTGDLDAAKRACEAVDQALGTFLEALEAVGGTALITADHGNAEIMWDVARDVAHTAHTLSPVPLIHVGPQRGELMPGRLADLAPTLLHFMRIEAPSEMTGNCLWRVA